MFEKAMAGAGEALLATMIAQGLRGDVEALKWLLNRAYPPRKGRLVKLKVEIEDLPAAANVAVEILKAVAGGDMSLDDGTDLLRLIREVEGGLSRWPITATAVSGVTWPRAGSSGLKTARCLAAADTLTHHLDAGLISMPLWAIGISHGRGNS